MTRWLRYEKKNFTRYPSVYYRGGHPNRSIFKIDGHTELTHDQKTPITAIKVGIQTNIFKFFDAVH